MPGTFTFRQVLGIREELRAMPSRKKPCRKVREESDKVEDGWAFLRAAELAAAGCVVKVLRPRGQAPVVCYRPEGAVAV